MTRRGFVGTSVVALLVAGAVVVYFTASPPATPASAEEAPVVAEAPPPVPELEPAPPPPPTPAPVAAELGLLRVESDVDGAQVFLDRRFADTTPVRIEAVALSGHQLHMTAEGFDGFAALLDVEPAPRNIVVKFREVRLDATIAVVHRHQFGACAGALIAQALLHPDSPIVTL